MKPARRGFTMVELLLVVAILGMLAALTWPVLGATRQAARRTTCASNLMQLGIAYQLYVEDYGRYPDSQFVNTAYIKDRRILFCPEGDAASLGGAASSYGYCGWIPPRFRPITTYATLSPGQVLVSCDQHVGQERIIQPDGTVTLTPPKYPYHLVLRASGAVQRVPYDQVRQLRVPNKPNTFQIIYPGEPGYEQAEK